MSSRSSNNRRSCNKDDGKSDKDDDDKGGGTRRWDDGHHQYHKNVVRLCGSSTSSCGYCYGKRAALVGKSAEHSSKSYGILATSSSSLTACDYEAMLHRGWRRSGLHIYKPDNWESCCPALTIRLQTDRFQISRSQKKVMRNMERALRGPTTTTRTTTIRTSSSIGDKSPTKKKPLAPVEQQQRLRGVQEVVDSHVLGELQTITYRLLRDQVLLNVASQQQHANASSLLQANMCRYKVIPNAKTDKNNVTVYCTVCASLAGRSMGALQRNLLCQQLAAALEKEQVSFIANVTAHQPSGQIQVTLRNVAVTHDNNNDDDDDQDMSSSTFTAKNDPIHSWLQTKRYTPTSLSSSSWSPPYSLTITTLAAHESALMPDVHRLYFEYQQEIHGDPNPLNSKEEEEEDWGEASPAFVHQCKKMLSTIYSPEEMKKMVGKMSSFYRFLVESPIIPSNRCNDDDDDDDGLLSLLGTVHQHYRIDGVLIGVGVVDVLPTGTSSVYAFYDATFSRHVAALGKYISLQEIQETAKYYYLGYYIESCPKMRYKAEYKPSELLCPTTYEWVDAAQAQAIIQQDSPQRHCCTLYKNEKKHDEQDAIQNNYQQQQRQDALVHQIGLDVGAESLVTVDMLHTNGQEIVRPMVREFIQEVGCPDLCSRFVLKLV